MDSLYDNLENYEDVNIIQDLKDENTELKLKLERYSSTLNQLQIDFDKLTSEYKKLEMNYSSLLKTARAEIEKKTNMITQLNIEKDMFVIRTFQNKGKRLFSNVRHNMNIKPDCSGVKCEKSFNKDEITPVENMCNRDRLENKQGNYSADTKENIDSRHTKNSQKIMNRRKSMPAVSHYENETSGFNSEGENEQHHSSKDQRIREGASDRRSNMTSCVDDRHSNYNMSNDSSKRSSRYSSYHYENKHRSREKSRNRQYRSPERIACRSSKENYHQQYRRSRSPPTDRHTRYKSRDRRSNYNNYATRNERNVIKHKLQPHSEEPSNKKIKIDSYGQYLNPDKDLLDEEFVSATHNLISPEDPYRSSQSPDRVNLEEDNNEQFMVKEIVQIATTPLEDPRIRSKKYILHNENGKVVLKKCSSDVYIKLVDKSIWKIPNVTVPDSLLQKPLSASKSENHVMENSPNIDNLNLDISFENDIGSPNPNLIPTELSPNEQEKYEEKHYRSKHLDFCKENSEYIVYKIPKINKTTNDTQVVNEGCLRENDLHKTIKSNNLQDPQPLDLPNIISQDTQHLQDLMSSEIIHTNSTPNIQSHEYQVLDKVSLSTVEGDLLLSDDASDNMDFQKQNISQTLEKNSSTKIKTKGSRANKSVLGDKSSHYEVKVKYSGEIIKNKESAVDNMEQQQQSNYKISKKDSQADDNLCEKTETRCDESRTFETIPVDDISVEVKDKCSGDKETKSNSGDETSYDKNIESSGRSQTVQNIKNGAVLCTRSIELGKSKIMDSEHNADSDCDGKDNQSTNKYNQGVEVSSEEARHTYETFTTIKIGLVDNVSHALKNNPSTDIRMISNILTKDTPIAETDIGSSNTKISESKVEISKKVENKLVNSSIESEIKNSRPLEVPYKKEKSSRKSKAKKDVLINEILPEGNVKPSSETRPLYERSYKDSIKSQVKEICNSQIGTDDSHPAVAISCKEKDMHRSGMNITDNLNVKSSDLSKLEMECRNQHQDIEKNVKSKTESESTNKKHRAKKKSPNTKVNEQSKNKITKKNTSKKGKETKIPIINNKFSDLFGDSNSLIMPEDLGIRSKETSLKALDKFVSIFDDTQSAVDLSVEHVKQIEKDSDNVLEKIPHTEKIDVRNCLKNVSNINLSLNDFVESEHVSDDTVIPIDENVTVKGNLYENLNPATSMDGSNVIIISTGVQSDCAGDDMTKDDVKNVENFAPKSNPLLKLKALATSTPLKIDVKPIEINDKHVQNNAQPQESSTTDVTTNSAVPLNKPDDPDIRIFVKRRRKVIRKP